MRASKAIWQALIRLLRFRRGRRSVHYAEDPHPYMYCPEMVVDADSPAAANVVHSQKARGLLGVQSVVHFDIMTQVSRGLPISRVLGSSITYGRTTAVWCLSSEGRDWRVTVMN